MEQVKCSQILIFNLLEKMNNENILNNSYIIIHSDHGPYYLKPYDNDPKLWRKNSSFFVSHAPFQDKGTLNREHYTISSILANFIHKKKMFKKIEENYVYDLDHSRKENKNPKVIKKKLKKFSKGLTKNL